MIISGNVRQVYQIQFNDLPRGDQEMYVHRRNIIIVVEAGEEEVEWDHVNVG